MSAQARERFSLDRGWRFHLGDAADYTRDFDFGHGYSFAKTGEGAGALKMDFDDSDWQQVTVPHDWVVALPFDQAGDKEQADHGFKPAGRTKPATAIGWYRRHFPLPAEDEGKRLFVEFDGIFRDSMVWLNGHYLGRQMSGYTGFRYDITDVAHYGEENVLTMRADTSHWEGWWYEGGGIYRHCWLLKIHPLHVAQWGTFVTSTLVDEVAEVTVRTRLVNAGEQECAGTLHSEIINAEGQPVATVLSEIPPLHPGEEREISQQTVITQPILWSLKHPHCYQLRTTVLCAETMVDNYETSFGIRTIRFDPDEGFFLNGESVKIKGVCCHQDHAGVGTGAA